MNNWQFDPEQFEDGRGAVANAALYIAGTLLLAFSGVTSFAFFLTYAGDLFAFISPTLSPFLAGLIGAISFEGMSVIWRYLRANHSNTTRQMAIAQMGSFLTLAGGLTVTVVYFGLQNQLIAPLVDDSLYSALSIIGTLLMIVGVSGNFALYHFYAEADATYTDKTNRNTMASMRASAKFATDRETALQTMQRTMREVQRELPRASGTQAGKNATTYLSSVYDGYGPEEPLPVPFVNGQEPDEE